MRVAILGGSFNPLHLGHLQLADELSAIGYEKVIFVPANIPAHKDQSSDDDPELRLRMTEQGVMPYGYEVSDCEIRRGGVSYMVETVLQLREQYEAAGKLGLVIGEDLLEGFHKWKRYAELLQQVDLFLARRGPVRKSRSDIPYVRLDNPDFPVSSTEIRGRAQAGRPYRFLVPPGVYDFIKAHKLYEPQYTGGTR